MVDSGFALAEQKRNPEEVKKAGTAYGFKLNPEILTTAASKTDYSEKDLKNLAEYVFGGKEGDNLAYALSRSRVPRNAYVLPLAVEVYCAATTFAKMGDYFSKNGKYQLAAGAYADAYKALTHATASRQRLSSDECLRINYRLNRADALLTTASGQELSYEQRVASAQEAQEIYRSLDRSDKATSVQLAIAGIYRAEANALQAELDEHSRDRSFERNEDLRRTINGLRLKAIDIYLALGEKNRVTQVVEEAKTDPAMAMAVRDSLLTHMKNRIADRKNPIQENEAVQFTKWVYTIYAYQGWYRPTLTASGTAYYNKDYARVYDKLPTKKMREACIGAIVSLTSNKPVDKQLGYEIDRDYYKTELAME